MASVNFDHLSTIVDDIRTMAHARARINTDPRGPFTEKLKAHIAGLKANINSLYGVPSRVLDDMEVFALDHDDDDVIAALAKRIDVRYSKDHSDEDRDLEGAINGAKALAKSVRNLLKRFTWSDLGEALVDAGVTIEEIQEMAKDLKEKNQTDTTKAEKK